jgi:hypothetical protein
VPSRATATPAIAAPTRRTSPGEINPRLVFERLFAAGSSRDISARRARYRRSILDFVAEDAAQLQGRLGANDRRKLDEYTTSIREIERRIALAEQDAEPSGVPDYPRPSGIPKDYQEHIRLMCDMIALAFQGDLTRVCTFLLANEGSNRSYASPLGISDGHHDLSHHGGDSKKHVKIQTINQFHTTQFAYLLEKLKAIKEGDGSLLDHCMIVYGSGIGDGDQHNHDDLPILLAGRCGGAIKPGRHLKYKTGTPLNNLYLAMLDRLDVPIDKLGDSSGRLTNLDG